MSPVQGLTPLRRTSSRATMSCKVARRSTATVLPTRSSIRRSFRTADEPKKRLFVGDHDALEGQATRGRYQRACNAREIIDLAGDQRRSLHRAGHLDQIDVRPMLFVDSGVFSDEESEKGKAECRIADADSFQLLGREDED